MPFPCRDECVDCIHWMTVGNLLPCSCTVNGLPPYRINGRCSGFINKFDYNDKVNEEINLMVQKYIKKENENEYCNGN